MRAWHDVRQVSSARLRASSLTFTSVTDKGLLRCESRSGHTLTSLRRKRDMAVGVSERLHEKVLCGFVGCATGSVSLYRGRM